MKDTINLDELLELIDKSQKTEEKIVNNSLDSFIASKAIKAGLDRVPNYVIYYEYSKHAITNLIPRRQFFMMFKKHFKAVRVGEQRSYLLDKSSFDLSREGKLLAKKHLEDEKSEKKRKK